MSASQQAIKDGANLDRAATPVRRASKSTIDRFLSFISSVRFGIVLLVLLVVFSLIGMLIVQQNVNGFDAYFASRTPAEKMLFGWLGLFDVYHTWYYNALLLILSLNIVLASIDHFPTSWSYIAKPKLVATREWLLARKQNTTINIKGGSEAEVVEKIQQAFTENGFSRRITESKNLSYEIDNFGKRDFSKMISKTTVNIFGERGRWNRMGAYLVHVALLTLFLGHFVALRTGFDADVRLMPGQTTNEIQLIEFNLDKTERYNVALPFTIICTDIQQKLIDQKGSIDIQNTLDWRTQIQINDPEYGVNTADVQLNRPFSYRGYRFFQASAINQGSARNMTLEITPANGGEALQVNLPRNGTAALPDGTKINYEAFFPDFTLSNGKPDTRSGEYNNPAVKLNIQTPQGELKSAYAFAAKLPDNVPIGAPVAGYKFHLGEFEKSPLMHILAIKYDPFNASFIAWYVGGAGLIFALGFVFFLSHQRVWAVIEKEQISGSYKVILGGDTNRNHLGFEEKFQKVINSLTAKTKEQN